MHVGAAGQRTDDLTEGHDLVAASVLVGRSSDLHLGDAAVSDSATTSHIARAAGCTANNASKPQPAAAAIKAGTTTAPSPTRSVRSHQAGELP